MRKTDKGCFENIIMIQALLVVLTLCLLLIGAKNETKMTSILKTVETAGVSLGSEVVKEDDIICISQDNPTLYVYMEMEEKYGDGTVTLSFFSDVMERKVFQTIAVDIRTEKLSCEVDDYNFDGYQDIKIFDMSCSSGTWYQFLLWNPVTGKFQPDEELSKVSRPSFDKEKQEIYGIESYGSAQEGGWSVYRYMGGKLQCVRSVEYAGEYAYSLWALEPYEAYRVTVWDYTDGKMQMVSSDIYVKGKDFENGIDEICEKWMNTFKTTGEGRGLEEIGLDMEKGTKSALCAAYYQKCAERKEQYGVYGKSGISTRGENGGYSGYTFLYGLGIVDLLDFNGDGILDLFLVYENGKGYGVNVDGDSIPAADSYTIEIWSYRNGEMEQLLCENGVSSTEDDAYPSDTAECFLTVYENEQGLPMIQKYAKEDGKVVYTNLYWAEGTFRKEQCPKQAEDEILRDFFLVSGDTALRNLDLWWGIDMERTLEQTEGIHAALAEGKLFCRKEPFHLERFMLSEGNAEYYVEIEGDPASDKVTVSCFKDASYQIPYQQETVECDMRGNGLEIGDYNFDGFPDFCILRESASGGSWYHFFLWNPQQEQFVYQEELSQIACPEFHAEGQYVTGHESGGAEYSKYTFYRYSDGRLLCIRSILVEPLYERKGEAFRVVIEDDVEGELNVVYDAVLEKGADYKERVYEVYGKWMDLSYSWGDSG